MTMPFPQYDRLAKQKSELTAKWRGIQRELTEVKAWLTECNRKKREQHINPDPDWIDSDAPGMAKTAFGDLLTYVNFLEGRVRQLEEENAKLKEIGF